MNAIDVQKRFNLFAVGDTVKGTVLSINKDRTEVKTFGGCFGFVDDVHEKLENGSSVEMNVVGIEDGLPVFEFDPDFLFTLSPQTGEARFVGTRGIVVEFSNGALGYYPAEDGLAELAETIKEKQKIICGCSRKVDDYFLIDSLAFPPPEAEEPPVEKEKVEDLPVYDVPDWPEDLKQKALNNGSQARFGKLILGYCYLAKVYKKETGIVRLFDGHKAQVVGKSLCPSQKGTEVFVRLVNIRSHARLNVEIINLSPKHQEMIRRVMEREFNTSANFDFNNGDEKIFAAAMNNCSEKAYGRYKLAMLYSVPIRNGVPWFEEQTPGVEIEVEVEANGFSFKENDIVFARITYMKIDLETKFKVRIEHVIS